MSSPKRIVLAYSGGLDTSVILRWLIETYGADVICYCGDVGQAEDLPAVAEKAMATPSAAMRSSTASSQTGSRTPSRSRRARSRKARS